MSKENVYTIPKMTVLQMRQFLILGSVSQASLGGGLGGGSNTLYLADSGMEPNIDAPLLKNKRKTTCSEENTAQ